MRVNIVYSIAHFFILKGFTLIGKGRYYSKKIYEKLLQKKDPVIVTRINHQRVFCHFSHQLPFYQKEFPKYDKQLSLICKYIAQCKGRGLNIIDVGANIGDTVVNIGQKDHFYLLIEGCDSYSQMIKKNLRKKYHYSLETCYLSCDDKQSFIENTGGGTGHLVHSNDSQVIKMRMLDSIVSNETYCNIPFDLIKIDTDGFDFKVLNGSMKLLEKRKPTLYFEWDKKFLEEQGEEPLSVFPMLSFLGYSKLVLFDNFGNYQSVVLSTDLPTLSKMLNNTRQPGKPFYYDVLAIHEDSEIDVNLVVNKLL